MSIHQLIIAPAAKSDLKDIYQYGLKHWGKTQSEIYLEKIVNLLWTLTEQPLLGVDRSELISDGRSLAIESHTLFYRVIANKIEIIRILHGRQDPERHLY